MTLIEVSLALALTALVIGVLAAIYAFASARAAHAIANHSSTWQASRLLDEIQNVVQVANTCSTVALGGGTALKCTLPLQGIDRTGIDCSDSFNSNGSTTCDNDPPLRFRPLNASRRGSEEWGQGQRVWFYLSDATGSPASTGAVPWRARCGDDSTPVVGNADSTWAHYYGQASSRYSLIATLTFSVNSSAHTVSIAVQAGSNIRSETVPTANESAISDSISMSRTVYWRNWRQ